MHFIETPIFTKRVKALMSDDEYRLLQQMLATNPHAGAVIVNSGGIRKVRWSTAQKGKRGGYRVLYYFVDRSNEIRMLFLFSKNERSDLKPSELLALRKILENW